MSQLEALRKAKTLDDLAKLLNFKPQGISYLLFKLTDAGRYVEFEISKRSGGMRTIAAPTEKLKRLQSNLSTLLTNCLTELEESGDRKTPFVHGFIKGKSIVTNARVHRNKRWVLNLDLQDFFATVNFGRVRGLLIKDRCFQLHPDIATLIAQIACRNNGLPQGAPSSPILANMVARSLDLKLVDIANTHGLRYSRYADDITFSTRKQSFPTEIACIAGDPDSHKWLLGERIQSILTRSGFAANNNKTRLQYQESRQAVTGLVVNKRVNVTREYRKQVRAMVYSLVTTGTFSLDNAGVARVDNKRHKTIDSLRLLQGMLGFIDWVDVCAQATANGVSVPAQVQDNRKAFKEKDLSGQERQYRKFLFYREFFAMERPVILTEGKTDKVHLYAAMKQQAALYPQLADTTTSPVSTKVRVFPGTERRTNALMGLCGGTSDLAQFIRAYERDTKHFFKPLARQPVIVLVDLDDGWKNVQSAISKKTGPKPDGTESFYWLGGNLYVVCIPPPPGAAAGCIEELYPAKVLDAKLGGKSFDISNKTIDVGLHYGKTVFSEKVVRPHADTIDFNGFNPLLKRLADVIEHHMDVMVGSVV